jgi:predicted Zn-dependent peptidase
MMLCSKFERADYNLELNVVREELKMKSPESFIEKVAFSGSAYERNVDHISYHKPKCLAYDAVVDYYHKYYTPQNIVLSIVSSIPFETIRRYVSTTHFAKDLPRPKRILPILNPSLGTLDSNCESNFYLKSGKGETARVEIGVRVCDQFKDREFHILNVLRNVVSNSMSSRLFVELREKRGLTYRSGSYMTLYETAGIFVLYAISDVSRLIKDGKSSHPGVIPVMFDILDELIKHGIKESELKMAKQSIKDTLKMESVAGGDKCAYNGVRVILNNDTEVLSNSEMYGKYYNAITKSDVNEIIAKYFASRRFFYSVVGGKLPSTTTLTKYLSHQNR